MRAETKNGIWNTLTAVLTCHNRALVSFSAQTILWFFAPTKTITCCCTVPGNEIVGLDYYVFVSRRGENRFEWLHTRSNRPAFRLAFNFFLHFGCILQMDFMELEKQSETLSKEKQFFSLLYFRIAKYKCHTENKSSERRRKKRQSAVFMRRLKWKLTEIWNKQQFHGIFAIGIEFKPSNQKKNLGERKLCLTTICPTYSDTEH